MTTDSRPLFSIVTVTLNCANKAVRTAESVLAQDCADYEYVVKDGGSTDGTVDRLREMGAVVHVSQDSGIYDAMNQALEWCHGRFVCFLNAGDDFAASDILGILAKAIQDNPSARLFYGDVKLPDIPRVVHYPDHLNRFFLYRKQICHQTWFTERSLLAEVGGFDTSFALMADYDLLLRLVLAKRVHYVHVPSVVVNYQYDGLTSCKSNVRQLLYERSRILRKNFSPLERSLYEMLILLSGRPIRRFIWDNPYTFRLLRWYFGKTVVRSIMTDSRSRDAE